LTQGALIAYLEQFLKRVKRFSGIAAKQFGGIAAKQKLAIYKIGMIYLARIEKR